MKILLLNPHRDATHDIVEHFRSCGVAVLTPKDTEDAWQMLQLHGTSVDLAIVHREWGKKSGEELGLKFIERFREDSVQGDLPYILTTEFWSEADCAQHQSSAGPLGANAYLRWPFTGEQLYDLVRQVIPETSTSIARPIAAEAVPPPLSEPPPQMMPMTPMEPTAAMPFGAAEAPVFELPAGSAQTPPSFELGPATSEAGTGFTLPEVGGLSIATEAPPSFEFTNGQRVSKSDVTAPVLTKGIEAPAPFELPPAFEIGALPPLDAAPPNKSASVPPPFNGPRIGNLAPPVSPSAPLPFTPDLVDPVSGPMVLEDASSLIERREGGVEHESSISLQMPPSEEGSSFTTAPPRQPPELTSATIAMGSGIAPPFPALSNESTRQLSSGQPAFPPLAAGGTVTMMPPPTLGHDSFDEGVPTTPALPPKNDLKADKEVLEKMPYLFESEDGRPSSDLGELGALGTRILPAMTGILKAPAAPSTKSSPMHFDQSMGDAVVPGGAAQAPDADTLKKYLMLREQDVAVLSTQLKTIQDQLQATADQVRAERARNGELNHVVLEQGRRVQDFEREKSAALESVQSEVDELRFQLKARTDRAKLLEARQRESVEETERLKERVRSDIRKIRVHEKELENRLEILKKDSEALIAARETKIIELKRKVDLLEFNMDLLQNQYMREKEVSVKLRERLAKAAQIVRVAGGLLDSEGKAALEQLTSMETEREAS